MINIRIAQADLKVTEVASYEHSRIHGVSNLNARRDGLRVLRTIVAERLLPPPATRSTAQPCFPAPGAPPAGGHARIGEPRSLAPTRPGPPGPQPRRTASRGEANCSNERPVVAALEVLDSSPS